MFWKSWQKVGSGLEVAPMSMPLSPLGCRYLQRFPRRHTFLRKSRHTSSSPLAIVVCLTSSLPESLFTDMIRSLGRVVRDGPPGSECVVVHSQGGLGRENWGAKGLKNARRPNDSERRACAIQRCVSFLTHTLKTTPAASRAAHSYHDAAAAALQRSEAAQSYS